MIHNFMNFQIVTLGCTPSLHKISYKKFGFKPQVEMSSLPIARPKTVRP